MAQIPYDVSDVLPFNPEDQHSPFPLAPKDLSDEDAQALKQRLDEFRYPLYTVEELGAFPPVSFLIPERLAAGEMTCLYGKGGTYKSFIALAWSCELVAAGHTVIYIAAEGASGLRARIAAWQKHHGVEELPGLFIQPANVNLQAVASVDAWLPEVQMQLAGRPVSLVVIDTLARNFVGGSENDPRDMGLFVEGCERIRREMSTATLILHHTGKDGKVERGTESVRNASFAMFKAEKKNGSGTIAELKCDRIKEAVEPPDIDLRMAHIDLPELGEDVSSLALADSTETAPPSSVEFSVEFSTDERKVMQAASRSSFRSSSGLSRKAIEKSLKCGRSKATEIVKSLVDAGVLRPEGTTNNRTYLLTDKGREAAAEK